MLYLKFALSFEQLADDMMNLIEEVWTDPFDCPAVIFPDKTQEQWFRLRWMSKKGVLANLNTQYLDKYLFQKLAGDEAIVKLPADVMRNVICAWMKQKDGDVENWKTLDDHVTAYLEDGAGSGQIDEERLFDFASMMAELFLEYETTRPSGFMRQEGISACWLSNEPKSFFKNDSADGWQKKLYAKLFGHDGCLINRVCDSPLNAKGVKYQTLPALFEERMKQNGSPVFPTDNAISNQIVFIFWHAGMGQFYRVALNELAKNHTVVAYVQNSCLDFWEDVENRRKQYERPNFKKTIEMMAQDGGDEFVEGENMLLQRWGRAGRENIKLWCEAVEFQFQTTEDWNTIKGDSTCLLHAVQASVANRQKMPDLSKVDFDKDNSLTLTAAPSKLREIEAVHSRICRLMLEEKVGIKDILVVAPDISEYRTAIYQVFAQETERVNALKQARKAGKDVDETALHIPFTIIDGASKESLTAQAIRTLFRVISNKSISRVEFFELVRNPVVQTVRGFTPDDVTIWQKWICDLNVYRDRHVFIKEDNEWKLSDDMLEEWQTGLNRLLLSRFSDGIVSVDDEELHAYSDLNSDNANSLFKFADCIESLRNLCQFAAERPNGLTEGDLENWFASFLNPWISMLRVPKSMTSENVIYQTVAKCIDGIKVQFAAGIKRVSWKLLEQTICSAAEGTSYTVGTIFVNGITFMNFTSNRILPVKHIFMIGMDASSFPGNQRQNSLDLRMSAPWPGDVQITAKNRYAFLSQLMSTTEGVHISYVHKNLQKDEDFFPSATVNELRNYIGKNEGAFLWKEEKISIDEDRPWSELFTGRERRNRELHDAMLVAGNNGDDAFNDNSQLEKQQVNLPERVSLWKLRQYIEDPFQFRAAQVLLDDIEDVDPEHVMYEPIALEKRAYSGLIEQLALIELREGISPEDASAEQQAVIDHFFNDLKSRGLLPDGIYADIQKQNILQYKDVAVKQLKGPELVHIVQARKAEIPIEQELDDGTLQTWMIDGTLQPHSEDGSLVIGVKTSNIDDKTEKYIKCYITALALIAEKGLKNAACMHAAVSVSIAISCCGGKAGLITRECRLSPSDALAILKAIYRYAFIEHRFETAPIKLIGNREKDNKYNDEKIKTLEDLKEKLVGYKGAWEYFKKAKLFDIQNDVGYSKDNFRTEWETVIARQRALFEPISYIMK